MYNELYHWGILGQKKGNRRWQNKDGSLTPAGKIRYGKNKGTKKVSKKTTAAKAEKTYKELTAKQLAKKIERMESEKKYLQLQKDIADMSATKREKKVSEGKKIVKDIFSSSTKNIGTQLVTYMMGAAINAAVGHEIVNAKKGQKDK